jgi:phospholipid/cholesterol/gamma-HCH transport system permease protein
MSSARFAESVATAWLTPWRLPRSPLLARLDEVLWGSLFLTTVTIACVGAAMCDQAAAQALRLLGDQSFIGPEYIVLGFEEFGPLIVAITLAARVGAGFAAEVATLVSDQSLDALEVFGAHPVRERLAPMGFALVVGGGALGLISALTWEVSGIFTMWARHGINPVTFFHPEAIKLHSVVICLLKNTTMAGLVFSASLLAGLRARGGSEEVGEATTRAVVWSLVLVLAANLLIDVIWFVARGPQ